MTILGLFDIIFCRNVMIYFNSEGKKKMIENFHRKLDDGGFLLLGHSECLMNISTAFTLRHFLHDMVYQKPERAARRQLRAGVRGRAAEGPRHRRLGISPAHALAHHRAPRPSSRWSAPPATARRRSRRSSRCSPI